MILKPRKLQLICSAMVVQFFSYSVTKMGKAGGPRYEILTARLGWSEMFFSQHCQYCPILPVY